MMKVNEITWLSEVAKEAELVISDGNYECIAFSHPCDVRERDILVGGSGLRYRRIFYSKNIR